MFPFWLLAFLQTMSDPQGIGNALALDLRKRGENSLRRSAVPPLVQAWAPLGMHVRVGSHLFRPSADRGDEPRVLVCCFRDCHGSRGSPFIFLRSAQKSQRLRGMTLRRQSCVIWSRTFESPIQSTGMTLSIALTTVRSLTSAETEDLELVGA